MLNISMKTMLEAGVHFGHQTYRWNPKMARFIFGERNGIHILDLQKTVKELKKTYAYVKDSAKEGKRFLFVGTKKQAKDIIREEALRAGVPCVYEKWLGGILTNFDTLKKSIKRLEELERLEADGLFRVMSKKEVSRLTKEKNRLVKLLSGIREMRVLPEVVFIVDPIEEAGALSEAHKLRIPVVGVCDTNCDPDDLDWAIPGNDDAARSIRLFCATMADAVIEGRSEADAAKAAAAQELQAEAADQQEQAEASAEAPAPEAEAAAEGQPETGIPAAEAAAEPVKTEE
ncbi:MAG: 30S ribosomal protein S2 [Elusimicrobia bacterium RIFOXYB2_FULL_62_6]|nr:MAG: 30S ribosomal protein S2 [Elusimicrobia bacterium RIFOXYB2_FULL_62_6]